MQAAQNQLLTRIGPGTPCGELMRRYWQPVALLDEFNAALDPRMATRPLKAVRLLGQDLVLFRDDTGRYGLLDRDCPHRGADLAFARHEGDGVRCPFHGWKFDATGRCLETPAEPAGSTLCQRVRQRSYPLHEAAGVLFAYLGPEDLPPPALPAFDAFTAPASHSFAFKGLWRCNWLQAFEVGIDPAHPSFLHRYLQDEDADPERAYGRQFRAASAGEVDGERWPMTRVMREFCSPEIHHDEVAPGLVRLTALRLMNEALTHVRVTHAAFPHTFVIPLSETLTITQMHVPVDDAQHLLVQLLHQLCRPAGQGDHARAAPGPHHAARLRAQERPPQRVELQPRRAADAHLPGHGRRRHQPARPVGRGEHGRRSRTARANTWAAATRSSWPTAARC